MPTSPGMLEGAAWNQLTSSTIFLGFLILLAIVLVRLNRVLLPHMLCLFDEPGICDGRVPRIIVGWAKNNCDGQRVPVIQPLYPVRDNMFVCPMLVSSATLRLDGLVSTAIHKIIFFFYFRPGPC